MSIIDIRTPNYDAFLEDSRERTESVARRARIAELNEIQDELISNAQGMSFEEFEAKLDQLREEMDYLLDEEYPNRDKEDANRKVRIIKLEVMKENVYAKYEFGCAEAQAEHDEIEAQLDALTEDDDEDYRDWLIDQIKATWESPDCAMLTPDLEQQIIDDKNLMANVILPAHDLEIIAEHYSIDVSSYMGDLDDHPF